MPYLQWALLVSYLLPVILGVHLAIRAVRRPRYFPIVCLMGIGYAVTPIGLATIRLSRLFHLPGSESMTSSNLILLISFILTTVGLFQADVVLSREAATPNEEA